MGVAVVRRVVLCLGIVLAATVANAQVMCTKEAKLCPDGSFVSRTGEDCEFAVCPTEDLSSFVIDANAKDMLAPEKYPADRYNLNVHVIMPAYKEMESLEQIAQHRDTLREEIIRTAKEQKVEISFYEYAGTKAGFPDILVSCPDEFFKKIQKMPLFGKASYPTKDGVALQPWQPDLLQK